MGDVATANKQVRGLCVYRRDPVMRFLNGHRVHWAYTALAFLVLFLGTKMLASHVSGALTSPTLPVDFQADFRTI